MHQPHQSEPLKCISTNFFSAFACVWAFGKSSNQTAAANADLSRTAPPMITTSKNRLRKVMALTGIGGRPKSGRRFLQNWLCGQERIGAPHARQVGPRRGGRGA